MANTNGHNSSSKSVITTEPLPASEKVYVQSARRADIRVPVRAITLSSSGHGSNGHSLEPVTVYDTSGPYTDAAAETDIREGLKPLRLEWIKARADVEEIPGKTISNGNGKNGSKNGASHTERFPDAARRSVLRAKPGCNVSQMHYARKGIVTPEMEYIAIRENIGREKALENGATGARTHAGNSFGAAIPEYVTPEFVRDEVARGRAIIPRTSIIRKASR